MSTPYTALARRYRSQGFDEVVGQEPIARTLRNAIATNRVAHAYLFTGTRGVGKTTMARLFAKALNGGSPEVDAAIMGGTDTDTIEIDAASNTGVDDVRGLIANAAYRPLRGKYKVYIIDEVHMLSTQAFNALLKTMEEPPEHVKFILCTTDAHKVPATIQSRCQRFDFRNIPTSQIAQHLAAVVKEEKASADPELLQQVARLGNGSMRDALSLLDRLLAGGERKITVKLLEDLLGLPDRVLIGNLIDSLAAADAGAALQRTDQLLQRGSSVDHLLDTILARLRDLMVLAACGGQTDLVDLSDAAREEESARASKFDAAGLVHMIALCENVQRAAKNSAVPRTLLDALVVRLAMTEKLADVTAVVTGRGGAVAAKKR
ncbi:DNA polymerase III subunit gamma/tau [Phycisphaerales bacterium]|nr:DNA polymerase III subunit gamma/tau [Phycisphaerales bacterium]